MTSDNTRKKERKTNAGGIRTPGAGNTNVAGGEGPAMDAEAAFFEELVAQRILSCVDALGKKFGRNKMVGILIGVSSNYIIESATDARPHYGTLSRFSRKEVTTMLDQLISRGYVRTEGADFPLLFLTDEGGESLQDGCGARVRLPFRLEPKSVPVPTDANLYELVRELRNRLAREEDLPAYCIFNNRVLLEVVETRPMDMEALGDVWGFSDKRVRKYGRPVVELMQEYVAGGDAGAGDQGDEPEAGADELNGGGDDLPPRAAVRPGSPGSAPAGGVPDGVPDFRTAAQIARDSGLA